MNYWIQSKKAALLQLLARVDVLMVNDSEARELSGDWNIHRAGRWILGQGPKRAVIKQESSAPLLIEPKRTFYVPAYPLENVFDPTGAGDAFAGGFMAYLARTKSAGDDNVRRAMVYGAAMGSYAVEQFGIRGFDRVSLADVEKRVRSFQDLTHVTLAEARGGSPTTRRSTPPPGLISHPPTRRRIVAASSSPVRGRSIPLAGLVRLEG